jgi:hypothetical protein
MFLTLALVVLAGLGIVALCIRKIPPGKAGFIVGLGGMRVSFD